MGTGETVPFSPWVLLATQAALTLLVGGIAWYLAAQRYRVMGQGREAAMVESLRLANATLPYLRRGLNDETGQHAAELIYEYFRPAAVSIVAGQRVVGFAGQGSDHHPRGGQPTTGVTRTVVTSARPVVARGRKEVGCPNPYCPLERAVVAPIRSRDHLAGVLSVYYAQSVPPTAGRVRLVAALAQLMGLQIELAELDRKTEQLAKAELAALQAQISPHFVYNTLNTISSFIRTKPDEARRLLTEFADFTRRAYKRRGEFAPFAQELEYVHQYLGFEKARFGERLQVVYRIDPEILHAVVPVLVLQPLVENAVRHGVAHKEGPVKVTIRAEDRGNECWISVHDDGPGIPREVVERLRRGGRDGTRPPGPGGLGLTNVHERLRSVYGSQGGLQVQGGPGEGTRVSFVIPKFRTGVAV